MDLGASAALPQETVGQGAAFVVNNDIYILGSTFVGDVFMVKFNAKLRTFDPTPLPLPQYYLDLFGTVVAA